MTGNLAAFLTGNGQIEISELPMPEAGEDDVIVRMEYVGICGSDVHFFKEGRIGPKIISEPLILGHESAGRVMEIGKNVKHLKVGDHVALEPGINCGTCELCRVGRYNLCPRIKFMASPPINGALRLYMRHPAQMVHKLPSNVTTLEGALIEPLAVGLHAAQRSNITLGDTVSILGGGCIGLMTLLAVKSCGASQIVLADLYKDRLEKALELGAHFVVNSTEENTVTSILELTGGRGSDLVFETAGNRTTVEQTVSLMKLGGTIVLVGNVTGDTSFDFHALMRKEGEIKSVFRYCNLYPRAIEAVASGMIDVKGIASHIFNFEHTQKAFELASQDKQKVVKVVIEMK